MGKGKRRGNMKRKQTRGERRGEDRIKEESKK